MEWQPIETAPMDDSKIILGVARLGFIEEVHVGGFSFAVNADEESCWWSDQQDDEIQPTHWMPLPKPPTAS